MSFPQAFVDPSSIAVVGATEDRAKWGYWLATDALAGAGRRQVWLVNRRAAQVLGHPCRPTVGDLPETPDLVVLCVPSEHVLPVVRDALAKGCRAFLGITAGLGADEDELAAMLNRADARMIGPNSLGLFNAPRTSGSPGGTSRPEVTVDAALGALGRVTRLGGKPRPTPATERIAMAAPAPGYWAARTFLTALGIAMPEARRVTDAAGFAEACASLRLPLVLKAGWIEHKSEHQAVRTGLGPDTAAAAFREMYERLGPGDYVVEEQDTRPGVVEMLIGARRDRDFGPTVAVGHGGVHAELWRDVSVELAPVDRQTAAGMLDRLRSRRLLDGWRGQPAVDVEAPIDAIVAVSEAVASPPVWRTSRRIRSGSGPRAPWPWTHSSSLVPHQKSHQKSHRKSPG
ncbi:acetate--CoA ligase family protein [Streptomyces sp. NBC_01483]|uniref:acetate--CoA ligase family protein n=1 Tax=Streptomyces sp. NBC_01483 TaxID=2903883 RepID=UPI002E33EDA6|nr:acetate--CoA ligase family protein [Streptomyces sp. NBC_01483]